MKYLLVSLLMISGSAFSKSEKPQAKRGPANYQTVKGHVRSNGTYVAPYIRTSPNGTTADNIRPRQ